MDIWPSVVAAGSGLIGALIGGAVTLLGHRSTKRAAQAKLRYDIAVYTNGLAEKTLAEFLTKAKTVGSIAERRYWHTDEPVSATEREAATAAMWLALEQVNVFCPEDIHWHCYAYAEDLADGAQHRSQDVPHVRFAPPRTALLKTARTALELGIE